jgi:hypothetical protein
MNAGGSPMPYSVLRNVLRLAFIAVLMFFHTVAGASESPFQAEMPCRSTAETVLKEWTSQNVWKKQPTLAEDMLYYSPTAKIGTWVEVTPRKSSITLSRVEATNIVSILYAEPKCAPEIKVIPASSVSAEPGLFTDQALAGILKREKSGFVYIWSPAMPLSADGVDQVRAAAKELHVPLTVILDPRANMKSAEATVQKRKWPAEYLLRNSSEEVLFRGMLEHFPTLLTYKDGKPLSPAIPGLKSAKYYEQEGRRQGL